MPWTINYIFVLIGTFLIAIVGTPLVRSLAFRVGAVDNPNARRINKKPMPSAGGLAIFLAFVLATLVFMPMIIQKDVWHISYFRYILPVAVGGAIVVLTGFIDDIFELKPLPKMLGIVIGAVIVWAFTDFRFDSFKIPFGGPVIQFGPVLTLILTVLWIAAITNAINLIDGLDGLVGGVSIISLMTMGVISYFFLYDTDIFLNLTIFVLVAAIIGFFPYNYHPAIIYLGDTGALFIGFMIGVLSLQGLKNATAVAILSPVIILGVPITDTVVAISAAVMGDGSEELGKTLLKAFVFSLTQQDKLPKTILFYNGGASLTCEGSPMLDDLKALEAQGVEIMTCGTCLNFYGLTEKLAVGGVTNMYVIAEKMLGAGNVVKP